MRSGSDNFQFHLAMYAGRLGFSRGKVVHLSSAPINSKDLASKSMRIFFWIANETPGSMVIIDNVLPHLRNEVIRLGLNWEFDRGSELPIQEVDWLICFKATPDLSQVAGSPRRVLLICDQAEVLWGDVPMFHEVVATSSIQFASLLAWNSGTTYFISESEPKSHLDFGQEVLERHAGTKSEVLLWHGGTHSLKSLFELKPVLIKWAETHRACLHIVCGRNKPKYERWGKLEVSYFPWSENQLKASASMARLAIIPAISRLKHSWLKPPSRVRCCYALGVPAIGDRRVPSVVSFCRPFGGPMASGSKDWFFELRRLWADSTERNRVALAGHREVRANHSTDLTARKWIRYLAKKTSAE
ncbi:MAG TPA: hypothetical protein DHU78_07350 [Opitutae bacterium]|nr:hypothetical protein [Opitutae bacterium]